MTSISEDQTLPLDLDGTSNALSSGSHEGHSESHNDLTSLSSDLEQPGTFANLTSQGRMSPHRTRTMKDQEIQLGEMKKENFGLKLRIYHLEEALRKKHGDKDSDWQLNIELQVQMEKLKKEVADKDRLLMQAKTAINSMNAQKKPTGPSQAEVNELERKLTEKEEEFRAMKKELGDAQREAEDANNRVDEMEALNTQLSNALQDNEDQLQQMAEEVSKLQQTLAQRAVPTATPPLHSRATQTADDPYAKLAKSAAELESVQARLAERERELGEMQDILGDRNQRIKEVELKLLSITQEMAANAGDHTQQMREKEEELEQCKSRLRETEEKLRDKEAELGDCAQERDAERQKAKEMESQIRRLQPLIQDREREIQDLLNRLAEAERQLEDEEHDRDKDLSDLRKKLSEARAKAREVEPELAAKQREIKRLSEALDDKEDELHRMRSKVRELEEALSQSKILARTTDMERDEQAEILDRLQKELEALRNQLRQQQTGLQHDLEGTVAAKEAIIDQLRRELNDLHSQLNEADRKYNHLNTTTAAEIAVLKASIDDLTRQLEQLQRALKAREKDWGELIGEKVGLERELDRLRHENQALRDQVTVLQDELANQAAGMEQAEEAISELRKLLDKLQDRQGDISTAELATLRGQLAALELALKGKEAELESLMQTLGLKDRTIQELQQELKRVRGERATAEERVRELENENSRLENTILELESQDRIHQLSIADLQERLTQAYAEKEEMARKLKLAENTLQEKDAAYRDIEAMYKQLSEELSRLQQQLQDLQDSPHRVNVTHHVRTTTDPPEDKVNGEKEASSRSTTMIFGNMSENLFLTILQRLQELYNEITAGRADSNMATSSLSARLEHLMALQRQLEESLRDHDSPERSNNTSYTTYYYLDRGKGSDQEEEEVVDGIRGNSTPKVTPKTKTSPQDPEVENRTLRANLEEMKRWNEALQVRLDENQRTRHVGVGREKDGTSPQAKTESDKGFVPPEKYLELTREVDRLLEELDTEKEKSEAERAQQQREIDAIQQTLRDTEAKVMDLEESLKAAMLRDVSTSTDHLVEMDRVAREAEESRSAIARLRGQFEGAQRNISQLKEELDSSQRAAARLKEQLDTSQGNVARLSEQLDTSQGVVAGLRGQLDFEGQENKKLRDELADMLLMKKSPHKEEEGLEATSSTSMPDLHGGVARSKSDSWTSPKTPLSERPDVKALKAKNEDITRLNMELQKKCHEQLLKTPSHSRPSSAGSMHWQSQLREKEEILRSEMAEKERALLAQVRNAEARLLEKELEWQAKLAGLRQEGVELETQLAEAMKSKHTLRAKLMEDTESSQAKDEEIVNLTRALSQSGEKIGILEERIDQLLTEKNAVIHELEQKIHQLERELKLSRQSVSRLRCSLRVNTDDLGVETDVGGAEAEILSLHETLDQLNQQFAASLEELQNLKQRHNVLSEQNSVLSRQLVSYQDQVRTLQSELSIYQQLVEDLKKAMSRRDTGVQTGMGEEGGRKGMLEERILEFLKEVETLRNQLNESILNNNTLAGQLKVQLDHTSTAYNTFTDKSTGTKGTRTKGKGSGTITRDHAHKRSVHTQHTTTFVHHKPSSGTPPSKPRASSSPKSSPRSHDQSRDFTDARTSSPPLHSRSDEFIGKSFNLDSSSSSGSFFSHASSSRIVDGEGSGGRGNKAAAPNQSNFSSFSLHGFGDFETLETRIKKALDSPSLQGQDRTFLEELLVYLRHQRQQLDESRYLLEKLEREHQRLFDGEGGGGILPSTHIPTNLSESGTLHPLTVHSPRTTVHNGTLPSFTIQPPSPHPITHDTSHTDGTSNITSYLTPATTSSHGVQTKSDTGTKYRSINTATLSSYGVQTTKSGSGTSCRIQTKPVTAVNYSQTMTTLGTNYGTLPSTTGSNYGIQTGTNYGTQTRTSGDISNGIRTKPASSSSPGVRTKLSFSPSYSTHSRSAALTSHGMQTSHASSSASSPRGVATVELIAGRSRPIVNGYGGRGGASAINSGGSGRDKVDLSSLYEQLLQTHSSLVEARSALNQQQT